MRKTRPLTPSERVMLEGPTLQSQFPIAFANGNRFTEVKAICKKCGQHGADSDTHGEVIRSFPKVAVIRGVMHCRACRLNTPFEWRLYDDHRFTGLVDGKWVQNRLVKRASRLQRILRWLLTPPVPKK